MAGFGSHVADDVKYKCGVFDETPGGSKPITARTARGRAVQLQTVEQVDYFVLALRGERGESYSIKVTGQRFDVFVQSNISNRANTLILSQGDWMIIVGQGRPPRHVNAKEFAEYWEVQK